MSAKEYIALYVDKMRTGDPNAFHCLLESPCEILPELITSFHAPEYADCRSFLLRVIWEYRQPSAIPFLSEALRHGEPGVWKEALNGLVCFSTPEAIAALAAARSRPFEKEKERAQFLEWLEEAIEQAETSHP